MVEEMSSGGYESFPLWIVFLSNFVSLSIYAVGACILAGFGFLFSILYLVYCVWIELMVLKRSCVNCYYYGRFCGLGRGRLCSLFFKKGDPKKFTDRKISWADLLPDFMVSLLPLVGGLILLVRDFSWLTLALLVVLVVLSFAGNAVVRGSFACKYCKQRELGCPAEKLFSKKGG